MAGRIDRHRPGLTLLWLAAVAGGVHTAFSIYWAAGGMWLLNTVGEGAVELQRDNRPVAVLVLLFAALLKGAGAAVPLWTEYRGGDALRRLVRGVSWVGGVFLALYGSVLTVLAIAVLNGTITPAGEVDRTGLRGHALVWDPLFAVWGLLLLGGLWWTRPVGPVRPPAAAANSGACRGVQCPGRPSEHSANHERVHDPHRG
jgi:hypothetical protein